jgi:hypothetical protein
MLKLASCSRSQKWGAKGNALVSGTIVTTSLTTPDDGYSTEYRLCVIGEFLYCTRLQGRQVLYELRVKGAFHRGVVLCVLPI